MSYVVKRSNDWVLNLYIKEKSMNKSPVWPNPKGLVDEWANAQNPYQDEDATIPTDETFWKDEVTRSSIGQMVAELGNNDVGRTVWNENKAPTPHYDYFDLEQAIMSAWTVIDDLKTLSKNWKKMDSQGKKNIVDGMIALYDLKMHELFEIFEKVF